jgi:hypothetical protein
MKLIIASFLMTSFLFVACSTPPVETEEVAEVVLAEDAQELKKMTFLSDDGLYIYSFEYENSKFKYFDGQFVLTDRSEIVTYTSNDAEVGIKSQVGGHSVLRSEESSQGCDFDYRVVLQDSENLVLRSKTCEGQNSDLASKALDLLLEGLTIDAL